MKNILCSLAILAAVAIPASLRAQTAAFEISSIEPSVVPTPDLQFRGTDKRNPQGKNQNWVEVEVEFAAAPEFTEEVTVKYYIALAQQLLVGEVTHINVPQSRKLYSVMYVPPRTIERLMGGKSLTKNAFDNIAVQLLVKGQLVAQSSWKGNAADQWFTQVQQIPNLVLNKNQTPFAPLYWDRYEMIKPEGR